MAKRDTHQEITDTIIQHLEGGALPWRKEFTCDGDGGMALPRRANGEFYKGINTLILWVSAATQEFTADQWFTFKQAKSLGANVRKGERGTKVVFFSAMERENDQGEEVKIPFLKSYTVFNAQQIENLPCDVTPDMFDAESEFDHDPVADLEEFFNATGANVVVDGTQPCYRPATDTIHMPRLGQFESADAYYGTLAHELIHWTGASRRLDRLKKFNTKEDYAFEELIAELGSCFLTARVGGTYDASNSAAYIGSWLAALKNDKKFIFRAAAAAQKATDFAIDTAALADADTAAA